jgi:hypothetical protein
MAILPTPAPSRNHLDAVRGDYRDVPYPFTLGAQHCYNEPLQFFRYRWVHAKQDDTRIWKTIWSLER